MRPHQSTPLPQIFFSLYLLNQSFNFLSPTDTLILLIISYSMIYISSQTTHNSMRNCLFYAFSCFAYNTSTTTAINMFLPPFESSYRPLSNDICPVQMSPAIQNAMQIQCWIQGIKYSAVNSLSMLGNSVKGLHQVYRCHLVKGVILPMILYTSIVEWSEITSEHHCKGPKQGPEGHHRHFLHYPHLCNADWSHSMEIMIYHVDIFFVYGNCMTKTLSISHICIFWILINVGYA